MNKIFTAFKPKKIFLYIFFVYLIFGFNCSYNQRKYKNKINGLSYGYIHRMGSILSIAVKDIDTVSQNVIINFLHCLEDEEGKRGRRNTSLIKIHDRFLYIDQITPKNLYARVWFKPYNNNNVVKRKITIEYIKSKKILEVDYDPSNIDCNLE